MRTRRLLLTVSASICLAAVVTVTAHHDSAFAAPPVASAAAEGGTRRLNVFAAPDASFEISATPADPEPLVSDDDWIYDLRYDRGDLYLVEIRRTARHARRQTPRVMGRFALELFSGPTLVERVRFDFPLLGADESVDAGGAFAAPRFSDKLRAGIGVFFPRTDKGNRLELLDRKTGTRWDLPWPPHEAADPKRDR